MNREILHIALPAIVTNITIPLLGLVDTAIAGHLSSADGAVYISAVAVGAMMFNLIYWNFGFLRMGTSGLTAQAYGRADKAAATLVLQHASVLALLIGLGIIALQWPLQRITLIAIGAEPGVEALALTYFYIAVWGAPPTLVMMAIKGWMIGMQDSKHPMHISIGVNVVNILLSLTAVTVLGLGFKGIAIGTVVAQWLGLGYSLWILRRKYGEHLSGVSLRQALHFRGARGFFRVNVHIFVRSTLMMVQALFFTSASARAGNMTLAVNTLILHMGILFSYFMDGLSLSDGGLCEIAESGMDLGAVGEAAPGNPALLNLILNGSDCLPLISSIGITPDGRLMNVNADDAAMAVAEMLWAASAAAMRTHSS